jgi:hypothetical protein
MDDAQDLVGNTLGAGAADQAAHRMRDEDDLVAFVLAGAPPGKDGVDAALQALGRLAAGLQPVIAAGINRVLVFGVLFQRLRICL